MRANAGLLPGGNRDRTYRGIVYNCAEPDIKFSIGNRRRNGDVISSIFSDQGNDVECADDLRSFYVNIENSFAVGRPVYFSKSEQDRVVSVGQRN